MYDALTTSYRFACPTRGEASVRLSSFRNLERLPGPAHPTVYRVRFDCPCGGEHEALLAHDELDWAPLGLGAAVFVNLMTAKLDRSRPTFSIWPCGGSKLATGLGASFATRKTRQGRSSPRRSSCSLRLRPPTCSRSGSAAPPAAASP